MFTLILILLLALAVFCVVMYRKDSYSMWDFWAIFVSIIFFMGVIFEGIFIWELAETRILDDKIQLYETQNEKIESQIEETVKSYMTYESTTFKDLKVDNYMAVVSVYPDLKSNELVQQQMVLYTQNNDKITELKEQQINKSLYKFLLYFGK